MADIPGEQLELLELTLLFHNQPLRLQAWCRTGNPLPAPLTPLLRLLAPRREDDALLTACAAHCGTTRDRLVEAARFFVEQVCLAENRDYYRIMGLQPRATDALIKEHYRLLMRAFHPDRSGVSDAWADRFAERVNRAYRVLRRPETRARYDRERADRPTADDAWGDFVSRPPTGRPPRPAAPRPFRPLPDTISMARRRIPRPALRTLGGVALIGLAGAGIFLAETSRRSVWESAVSSVPIEPPEPRITATAMFGRPPSVDELDASPREEPTAEQPLAATPDRVVEAPAPARASSEPVRPPTESRRTVLPADPQPRSPPPTVARPPAEQPAVVTPAPPPVPKVLSSSEILAIVQQFKTSYEKGDITVFMSLFAADARSSAGTGAGLIRRQHQVLFATTRSRSMELEGLRLRVEPDGKRTVSARYRIQLRGLTNRTIRTSNGTLQLGIVRHADGSPRIREFFYLGQPSSRRVPGSR